jgi:hypothetical protein
MPTRRQIVTALVMTAMAPSAFAQFDNAAGIRQMLIAGTRAATTRLGRRDGFFGDSLVRIPLPGILRTTQQQLRPLGLAGPLDDLELRVNRAAESAMPEASDLVVSAINRMTLSDGIGILTGGDTAATDYLERETSAPLAYALHPVMRQTLVQSGAYAGIDRVALEIDRSPTGSTLGQILGRDRAGRVTTNLRDEVTDFAVTRALDGVFHYVGEEERSFRRDPINRGSDVLRGILGGRRNGGF